MLESARDDLGQPLGGYPVVGGEPCPGCRVRQVPRLPDVISEPKVPPRIWVANGPESLSRSESDESQDEQERHPPWHQWSSGRVLVCVVGRCQRSLRAAGVASCEVGHGSCIRMGTLPQPGSTPRAFAESSFSFLPTEVRMSGKTRRYR